MRLIWERIITVMSGHGWVTAGYIADKMDVSISTVRPELHRMMGEGLVEHDTLQVPKRKGKPHTAWRLVAQDDHSLERRCRDIADGLEAHGGTQDANDIRQLVRRCWALRRQRDRKTALLRTLRVRVEANARLCEEALGLRQGDL
jgi:predicted ArsR family transcriptional regulator